jgi:tetratricopeptide (TPR) repeat protein
VLAGTTLASLLLGFLPLFAGPGYESALGLGLLLPLPLAGMAAARALPRPGAVGTPRSPLGVLTNALGFALLVLGAQLLVLLAHGARAGFCDAGEGLLLCLLGPALGALLAACWGTLAGLGAAHLCARQQRPGAGRRALALALAAAGPLGGVLVSLWRFWSSPMIFAFDPFVGFFAGTLYDTVIDSVPRLLTYRAGSLGSLLAAACLTALLRRSALGRLRWAGVRRRGACAALGVLGLGTSFGVYWAGPQLGHYQSVATIAAVLGQKWSSARCDILYPSGLSPARVQLLGSECDAHIAEHEAYFQLAFPGRITVFAFLSVEQKGALMGAWNTYIAKPWRHEVYIQNDNYPHPVLSHELAHVVAGSFARGPFDVAGPAAGWIPDPGRIEGFAVAAAAPSTEADYTLFEWTRALRDIGLLPPLQRVFRLSFLGQNSSTAYTVAGTFVAWLHEAYGAARLRTWYAGADLETAFGKPLAQLESEFSARLDGVQVPAPVLDLAKSRFDRPAIFGRRCPHEVDELLENANAALDRMDPAAASVAYSESLRLDPSNFGARVGLAVCEQRRGAAEAAVARYAELGADTALTRVQRGTVQERLGDAALLAGDLERAEQRYAEAERDALDEGRMRTIAVKRYAVQSEGRQAVTELLIGDPERGSDLMQSSAALGEWSARDPRLGLADYLIGKNLYSRARWQEAQLHLERALVRELPLPSVRREALRVGIFTACALGDRPNASARLREYLTDSELSLARREGMRKFAELCRLVS